MDCIKCGNQLRDKDKFCNRCGNKIKPASNGGLSFVRVYERAMTISYGVAILACFICNLATEHTLSWFFIVLSGVALAYSITNIPVVAGKYKIIAAGSCATAMLYVLLFVCNWFEQGDWLFSVAYPVATVSLVFGWAVLLICASRHMNWLIKSALISFIAGVAMITINLLCGYLLGEPVSFYDYLSPVYWDPSIIGNKITFICCICYSLIVLTLNVRTKSAR